jgi:hypothetical protein
MERFEAVSYIAAMNRDEAFTKKQIIDDLIEFELWSHPELRQFTKTRLRQVASKAFNMKYDEDHYKKCEKLIQFIQ